MAAGANLPRAFADPRLLRRALTHKSFGRDHNERLEWLGDALLQARTSQILFARFPDWREGRLTLLRQNLVSRAALARAAARLGLREELRLGKSEIAGGGADKKSILAGAVEALIGAAFEDGGEQAAASVIDAVIEPELESQLTRGDWRDDKTRLQEFLQQNGRNPPRYVVRRVGGEAHAPRFAAECQVEDETVACGEGGSRAAAEQAAAELACALLLAAARARSARAR